MEKKLKQIEQIIKKISYKSDIFCKLFTFNLDFPSLRFPLATFLGCCHFPIFHTFLLIPAYFFVVVPSKKESLPNKIILSRC